MGLCSPIANVNLQKLGFTRMTLTQRLRVGKATILGDAVARSRISSSDAVE